MTLPLCNIFSVIAPAKEDVKPTSEKYRCTDNNRLKPCTNDNPIYFRLCESCRDSQGKICQRMIMAEDANQTVSNIYTYRDIRDDRVLTYFDLPRGKSKTLKVRLQASYLGSFTLPAVSCEAMYEAETRARTMAGTVKVVK